MKINSAIILTLTAMLIFSNAYAWNDSTGTRSKKESTSVDANSVVNYGKYGTSISPITVDANGSQAVVSRGDTTVTTVPLTITAGAYTLGYCVGGKQTLASFARVSGGSGMNIGVVVTDLAKQDAALGIIFFSSDPSATTFTDNAALDIADADLPKVIGTVRVLASDYQDLSDNSVATVFNKLLGYELASGQTIYFTVVMNATSGATYAGTTDVQIRLIQLPD